MWKTWKGRKSFNLSLVWVCLAFSLSRPDPLFLATFECDSRKLGYNLCDSRCQAGLKRRQLNCRTLNCAGLIDPGLINVLFIHFRHCRRSPAIKYEILAQKSSNFQLQPLFFTLIPFVSVVMTHFHLSSSFRAAREWRQHSQQHGISWIADDDAKNVS